MPFKSGFVSILGKPNVGKSTLLNKLLRQKVSIVSPKPQTTRNSITGILNGDDYQVVFLDTPGIHKSKNKLDSYMQKEIQTSSTGVDLLLYLIDSTKPLSDSEINTISNYASSKTPLIVVVNKIDDAIYEKLLPQITKLNNVEGISEVVPISARTGKNTDELLTIILKYLKEGPCYYPQDIPTDKSEIFLAGEIVREKALWLLNEEIPHGIAVVVNSFKVHENIAKIDASIICEKENHKKIIIGKDGSKLKEIAEKSRIEMEKIFGEKVFLSLWVKVKDKWRDNIIDVVNLGYDEKKL